MLCAIRHHLSSSTRRLHHSCTQTPVRVRFAPSPTGYLHLGGLRTALFNYLFARKHGGQFILRIEDTDRTRFVEDAQVKLIETLQWLGLDYDEGPGKDGSVGPYIQSERLSIYRQHIDVLLKAGKAYPCFCTKERGIEIRNELKLRGKRSVYDGHCRTLDPRFVQEQIAQGLPHVIRFKNYLSNDTTPDLVYGQISFSKSACDDIVLLKADGFPVYHFANVVDDHHMKISHVIRGEEWIPSLTNHVALYKAFGWEPPTFAHLPILVNEDGSKLSKRSGDVHVERFKAYGYEPSALLNFVALMGASWLHSSTGSEVMTLPELVDNFDIKNVNKSRSTTFRGKLEFLQRSHLEKATHDEKALKELALKLREMVKTTFVDIDEGVLDLDYLKRVLIAVHDRVSVLAHITTEFPWFFIKPDHKADEAGNMRKNLNRDEYWMAIEASLNAVIPITEQKWKATEIAAILKELMESSDALKGKALMTPLRHALTGRKMGPTLSVVMETLGREESIARLRQVSQAATQNEEAT